MKLGFFIFCYGYKRVLYFNVFSDLCEFKDMNKVKIGYRISGLSGKEGSVWENFLQPQENI